MDLAGVKRTTVIFANPPGRGSIFLSAGAWCSASPGVLLELQPASHPHAPVAQDQRASILALPQVGGVKERRS